MCTSPITPPRVPTHHVHLPIPWGHRHRSQDMFFLTSSLGHILSPHPRNICLWYPFFLIQRVRGERETTWILSVLTQAGGVKRYFSIAFPLPSAIPHTQTLKQVALGICLGPCVTNSICGQSILVITVIYEDKKIGKKNGIKGSIKPPTVVHVRDTNMVMT